MRFFAFPLVLLALPGLLSLVSHLANGAGIMGIDFGTDWVKVALVKPGVPLEIVLNKESHRKTDAVVTIRDGVRYYGSDAVSFGLKSPKDSYGKLKNLLGRSFEDPLANEYRSLYDNMMLADSERGTVMFQHDANNTFSVEELVAMQLVKAKMDVAKFAEEHITDAVMSVPPFWTEHERRALLDAAEIAGLRVLALMNDETAVALNYAMTRNFEETPQYHIFYDMGAGSTVAAIVEFKSVAEKETSRWSRSSGNTTVIEVKSIGYDRTLGGHEFDVRLQRLLAKRFKETHGHKTKTDIFQAQKAMAKLLKEANRVKHILSANVDVPSSVEGLLEEIDFRTQVNRDEFEEMCKDLIDRAQGPIDSALKMAGLTLDQIQSMVLMGGNIRIPAIQKRLVEIVGSEKIAKHVNQDESAVMGATFQGALMSPLFRVTKKFQVNDISVHGISFTYDAESAKTGERTYTHLMKLFKELGPVGVKKQVGFKKTSNFKVRLSYDETTVSRDTELPASDLMDIKVLDVQEALEAANITLDENHEGKAKVLLSLTSSGMLSVENATYETTIIENKSLGESIKDTVLSFFGGGSGEGEKDPKEEVSTDGSAANKTAPTDAGAKNQTEIGPVTKNVVIPLKWSVEPLGIPPCSADRKKEASKRLKEMDAQDRARKAREEARNSLEAFIYGVMDYLTRDDIQKVSKETERTELSEKLSEFSDWLYDEGDMITTVTAEFQERLRKLHSMYDPIDLRKKEQHERPKAVEKLQKSLEEVKTFLNTSHYALAADVRLLEDADVSRSESIVEASASWLKENLEKQGKLQPHDPPAFLSKEALEKKSTLDRELVNLQMKKRLAAKKKSSSTATTTTSATATTPTSAATSTTIPVTTEETPATSEEESDSAPQNEDATTKIPVETTTTVPIQTPPIHDEF